MTHKTVDEYKSAQILLDGVKVFTDSSGKFCALDCPLLTYAGGTVCALEQAAFERGRLKSRYDHEAAAWRRCPACLRLMRKLAQKG